MMKKSNHIRKKHEFNERIGIMKSYCVHRRFIGPLFVLLSLRSMIMTSNLRIPHTRYDMHPITNPIGASSTFCQHWSASDAFNRTLQPFDLWYTHHPNWVVTVEAESKFCLTEVGDAESSQTYPYIRNLTLFYANQFHSPCNLLHKITMWSSGWRADFFNMQRGLLHSLYYQVPLFVEGWEGNPWHYTANKNDYSNLTCLAGDTTCYFLPYHGCESIWNISAYASMLTLDSNVKLLNEVELKDADEESDIESDSGWIAYLFMTRKQLWLRRAVFNCKEHFRIESNVKAGSECSVIHVRRSDVALDERRRYFPVADYVKMIPEDRLNNSNHYILLLTDDSNAIDEAHHFFPSIQWQYLNRPRFSGSSGGWENQTPSRNPANETIFILAEFELAMQCSVFVHGESGFSDVIYRHMTSVNSNVTRYRVEDSHSSFLDVPANESEATLRIVLKKMSVNDSSKNDIHDDKTIPKMLTDRASICSDVPTEGIIIVNMLGRLANNLFEVSFAKRLAEQLGCRWDVIYRSFWSPAFPTLSTDMCFPNALSRKNNRHGGAASETRQLKAVQKISATKSIKMQESDVTILFQALTYNELEPQKNKEWDNVDDRANNMTLEWIDSLGNASLRIDHMKYPLYGDSVDQLVLELRDSTSPVRVVSLASFFIHFDWMREWMGQISDWLYIEPSCCSTVAPAEGMIVIHIRDFELEDSFRKNFQVGVYRNIIDRYWEGDAIDRKVLVVCQPLSANSELVQDLVNDFGAIVQTGVNDIDAFCILSNAKNLFIASPSSTFSQIAALLATQKNEHVQVHYPTPTLDNPPVTLNVTSWKYHLINTEGDGIAEFDVNIRSFSQA